jgi:LmbE family N-acetylglucosaminyl deacetylase
MSRRAGAAGRLKAPVRDLLFPAAEHAWALAFAGAGLVLRPRAALATPTGTDRVLVIAPHPDDETLGCGGTIARHAQAGDAVCVLVVTDGGSSRAGGYGRAAIRAIRAQEAAAAITQLQPGEIVQFGLPESRWTPADFQTRLAALLARVRPTLIYTTSCVDFHPEHRRVALGLAKTLATTPQPDLRAVRLYELQVPLTPVLTNALVDIGPVAAHKERALAAYTTQRASFGWRPRQARYTRLLYRLAGSPEAFWELTPAAFGRVMAGYPAARPVFRSLRPRPFSDGAAWLVGLVARRRLKRMAAFDRPEPVAYTAGEGPVADRAPRTEELRHGKH